MSTQPLPVDFITYEYIENGTEIYFPQLTGLNDRNVQHTINQRIEQTVFNLVRAQEQQQGVQEFDQMISTYEIKANERNVLSLTLTNYAIHAGFAHGLTIMNSLTFDLETGKLWMLSDLFMQGSYYEARLAKLINKQIDERDFPVFEQPVAVNPEQDFYIADQTLVIYYQLYDISPHYAGLPKFPILIYQIEDLLARDSLLLRMFN